MVDNRGFMMTRSYTVVVMMMHQKGLYNYYDNEKEKLQIMEISLASSPSCPTTWKQLKIWIGKMQKAVKHLSGLGLTEAIDKNKANLSHMPRKKDLYLASVFHATAFELDTNGNPFDQDIYGHEELRSPKLFYSDHPFVFLVWDTQSGSLLFTGRPVQPKADKMRDEL
uniref:Serpin domain-containing protein n=1 Tax=Macaca nemestrina TaxID=9545 RepID=A0A2K6CKJ6_MACNE